MGRVLLLLSLIGLIVLGLGTTLMPQNPIFWIASGTPVYQYIRAVLGLILVLQLVTRPPRHILFRVLARILALAVGVWTVETTYNYHMLFLDTLCFLSAAISIGVAALERKPISKELAPPHPELMA